MEFLLRTNMLLSENQMNNILNSKIIVFGVGGVGGACTEALVRAGVQNITIVDSDTVSVTNKNRQIIAFDSTLGKKKTQVMKERILDINPKCNVEVFDIFYNKETYELIDLSKYDYIVDCIDTITSKLYLIEKSTEV